MFNKKKITFMILFVLIFLLTSIIPSVTTTADSSRDAPDIIIEDVVTNPTTFYAADEPGDTQIGLVQIHLKNNGTANATNETVVLTVYEKKYTNNTVNIPIDGQVMVEFPVNFTTEEDDSKVILHIELPNFPNTTADREIQIPGDIDLADFELDMEYELEAEAGYSLEIEVTIKNTGDALADFVDVTLDVNGTKIGGITFLNVTINGMNTSVYEWPIPLSFTPGHYILNASIEGTEIITSGDLNITEFRRPVLEVEFDKNHKGKIQSYHATLKEGERATIDVQLVLRNTGTADATNVTITITDRKGKWLGNMTINEFPHGYQEMVTVRIKVKSTGDFKIQGQVDYQQEGGHCYRTQTKESAKVVVEREYSDPICTSLLIIPLIVFPSIIFTRRLKRVG